MQRLISGFAWRYFDEKANIYASNEDYANVVLMILEFFAEVSSFKCLKIEHDHIFQVFQNFANPASQQYEDGRRQKMYERLSVHRCVGGVSLEQMYSEIANFERSLHDVVTYDHSHPYYNYQYHADKGLCKFKVRINRNFVSDLHQLACNEVKKTIDGYFLPICRGQILRKDFISNNRKYSEDSFEFYTPIKDTNLILTWRYFADLDIERSDQGNFLVLQYVVSFDAIREREYQTEYVLYDVSPLVET
jgi:hypothetical protein